MSVLNRSNSPNERLYRVLEDMVADGVCDFGTILVGFSYIC